MVNRIWPTAMAGKAGNVSLSLAHRQAKADTELTLSASPATTVGQILLTMAKFCYNTVCDSYLENLNLIHCFQDGGYP